jgi:hypothetical protein
MLNNLIKLKPISFSVGSRFILYSFGLYIFYTGNLKAQDADEEITLGFSTRIENPIEIEVVERGEEVVFQGINHSYHPYDVKLIFRNLQNLKPAFDEWESVMRPGQNKLITFKIVDISFANNYTYNLKSNIEPAYYGVKLDYTYLLPFSEGSGIRITEDKFLVEEGDVIHAPRKGRVTAIPTETPKVDRVSPFLSLEIRHSDGTMCIMFNKGLESLVEPGELVYAGQPVAKISSNEDKTLELTMAKILEKARLKEFEPVFQSNGQKYSFDELDGVEVKHDPEVASFELSSKEKKKFKKGKLF